MKRMKKIFALLIAVAMVMSMSISAFAADEAPKGSIKVTGAKTDPQADTTTYEAYRIFDMTTDGNKDDDGKYTAVAYTINADWTGFFAAGGPGAEYIVDENPGDLNQIAVDGTTKYINITETNVAAFAKAAYEYAMTTPVDATASQEVAKGTEEVTFSDLDLGYYMVYPVGASINIDDYTSIVSITSTNPDAEIAQKAKYPTLDKEADDISVEVGQTVTYTLTSSVPDTTGYTKYEMMFADTTSTGLTFDGTNSITVKIGETTLGAADYTVSTTNPDFELTIDMLKTEGEKKVAKYTYGDAITITYTATVNSDAVTKIDNNTATLTYNNNPKDEESTGTTPPVEVETYSAKIQILKVDNKNKDTKLAGAQFVLRCKTPNTTDNATAVAGNYYKFTAAEGETKAKTEWIEVDPDEVTDLIAAGEADKITVVTTNDNGEASFDGLEDGTYELIEIVAPDGYNLLTDPVEVVIAGDPEDVSTLTVTSEIGNNSGTELPSTGGIGTTIFYVVGAILVIGAGVVLVTRRRMDVQ